MSVTRGRYGRNYRRWKRIRTWRQQADESPAIALDATSSVAVLDLVDKECPRKPELIKNRKCFKKCKTEADCKGRNKSCLCDDVCGKSCVKPSEYSEFSNFLVLNSSVKFGINVQVCILNQGIVAHNCHFMY